MQKAEEVDAFPPLEFCLARPVLAQKAPDRIFREPEGRMMLLISLAILIASGYAAYVLTKNILHPSVVYAAIWVTQLTGLLLFGDRFVPLSEEVLFVVALGGVMFTVGGYLSSIDVGAERRLMRPRKVRRDPVFYWIAAIAVGICAVGQYQIFINLVSGVDFATSLVYARVLTSVENEDIYGWYKYGTPIAFAALLALQIMIVQKEASRVHKLLYGYFLLATFCMSVLSTGRGPIISIVLALSICYVLKSGVNWRMGGVLAGIVSSVFVIFWVMGRAMGKVEDEASGALDGFILHLFSSVPALSVYLDDHPLTMIDGAWGANTFRFFIAVAAAVGLTDRPPSLVQDFVQVPHLTNLYTNYLQYIQDFGLVGVMALPLLLGFAHSRLFRWFRKSTHDEFAFYVLIVSYLPLVQTVFMETHFSLMSSWIQLVLLGLIMTKAGKKTTGESL